jgi:CheY-like chemotaxis protein
VQLLSAHNHYDVVMTDFCMPEMNGVDLYKVCKNDVQNKSKKILPPFVLFSAYLDDKLENEALKLGFFATLKKPFTNNLIKHIFEDVKKGKHLIKSNQETMLLLAPENSKEQHYFKTLAYQENYKLIECHDVATAEQRYNSSIPISALFVSVDVTKEDTVGFYKWCLENKRSVNGGAKVPPFCVMFDPSHFSDQHALLSFLKEAKSAGINRVINTTDGLPKVSEMMRCETFLHQNIHKPTVLVVEVSTFARNYIASVVQENGYAVKHASHIEEALHLYAGDKNICLILTDTQLPDGSAINLLKKVSTTTRVGVDGEISPAKVVVTGTKPEINVRREMVAQGFADYLQKPLDNKKIKAILSHHLSIAENKAEPAVEIIEDAEVNA